MASSVTNFTAAFGAAAGFATALQAYFNNEPGAAQNLKLAAAQLTSAMTALGANPALEPGFSALGVPAALAALQIDENRFASDQDGSSQQLADGLAMAADGLGALAGGAAIAGLPFGENPAVLGIVGTLTLLSTAASIAQLAVASGEQSQSTDLRNFNNALNQVNPSNGIQGFTIVSPDAIGNTSNLVAVNLPTFGGPTNTVVFGGADDPTVSPPTVTAQTNSVTGSTITFDNGDGVIRTATVMYQTEAGNYVVTNVIPDPFANLPGSGVEAVGAALVNSITPPQPGSTQNVILSQTADNSNGSITDTDTLFAPPGSKQANAQYTAIYNPDTSGSVATNGQTVNYTSGDQAEVSIGPSGDITIDLTPISGGGTTALTLGARESDTINLNNVNGPDFTTQFTVPTPGGTIHVSDTADLFSLTSDDGTDQFTEVETIPESGPAVFEISGQGGTFSISNAVINLSTGTQAQIIGSGNTVNADDSAVFSITGDNNSVNENGSDVVVMADGDYNYIALNGSKDSVQSSGSDDATDDYGTANAATLLGANDSAYSETTSTDSTVLLQGDNTTANLYGAGASGSVLGTGDTVYASGANSSFTVSGSDTTIVTQGINNTITDTTDATSNYFETHGDNTAVTINGTNSGAQTFGTADSVSIYGSENNVTEQGPSDSAALFGSDEQATILGAGSTSVAAGTDDDMYLHGNLDSANVSGTFTTTVADGNNESVTSTSASSSNYFELDGTVDAANVSGTGSVVQSFGPNDTVMVDGSGDGANFYDPVSGDLIGQQFYYPDWDTTLAGDQSISYADGMAPTISVGNNADLQIDISPLSGSDESLDLTNNGVVVENSGGTITGTLTNDNFISVDGSGNVSADSDLFGVPDTIQFLNGGSSASYVVNGNTYDFGSNFLLSVSGDGNAVDFNSGTEQIQVMPLTNEILLDLSGSNGQGTTTPIGPAGPIGPTEGVPKGDTFDIEGTAIDVYNSIGQEVETILVGTNTIIKNTLGQDGSVFRSVYDLSSGSLISEAIFGGDGNLKSVEISPNTNYDQYIVSVADTIAGQVITQFLVKNNQPASLALQAFANAGIKSVVQGTDFSTALASSLNSMASGLVVSALTGPLANQVSGFLNSLGLPAPLSGAAGNALSSAITQQLTQYIAQSVFDVSPLPTIVDGTLDPTTFAANLGEDLAGALETAGFSLAGSELAGALVPSNNTPAQIGGDLGAAVGTFLLGPELGPLAPFVGDFLGTLLGDLWNSIFGGRGTPFADGAMTLTGNQLMNASNTEDNGGQLQVSADMEGNVEGVVNPILADIVYTNGATVAATGTATMPTGWNVGYYKDLYFSFNGQGWPPTGQNEYVNADDAVANAIISILGSVQFSGKIDPVLVYALDVGEAAAAATTGSASQQLPVLLNDFDAAYDYVRFAANPAAFDEALAASGSESEYQSWQNELVLINNMGLNGLTVTTGSQLIISNTSANIIANAAALNKLIAANMIASISFTDPSPTLSLTTAQVDILAPVLAKVMTPYNLIAPGDSTASETEATNFAATSVAGFNAEDGLRSFVMSDAGTIVSGNVTGGVDLANSILNPVTIDGSVALGSGSLSAALQGEAVAAWNVTNNGSIQGGTGDGIELLAGGTVTNTAVGWIEGNIGVQIQGSSGVVLNSNTIDATNGVAGIKLGDGGAVYNMAEGHIISAGDGIIIDETPAELSNAGMITAGASKAGLSLFAGGNVTNTAGGTISGGWGIAIQGATDGTVDNAGALLGSGQSGVFLTGGTVINRAGGLISGNWGVADSGAAATVINDGTIIGAGGTAVALPAGFANSVYDSPGAVFEGLVSGGNPGGGAALSTLELGASSTIGSLSGLGSQYVGFNAVTIDPKASWAISGATTGITNAAITDRGTLVVSASTLVGGGTLDVGDNTVADLQIASQGTVGMAEITLGADQGSTGLATVTGSGSTLADAGRLTVGQAGNGSLNLQNFGTALISGEIDVGASTIGPHNVMIAGSGTLAVAEGASLAFQSNIIVGNSGLGSLSVESDGTISSATGVVSSSFVVANQSGASGSSVNVTGAGSNLQVAGSLVVGNAGFGQLSIAQGGTVNGAALTEGAAAGGSGVVSIAGTGSGLNLTGALNVGSLAPGELSILNGGEVTAGSVTIGAGAGGAGNLVIGAGSTLTVTGSTTPLVVGVSAAAVLNIQGGTLVLSGSPTFGPNGRLVQVGGLIDPAPTLTVAGNAYGGGAIDEASIEVLNTATTVSKAPDISGGSATFLAPLVTGGSVSKPGIWNIDSGGTLVLDVNSVASTQEFTFADATGVLEIGQQVSVDLTGTPGTINAATLSGFQGSIDGYVTGDQIIVETTAAAGFAYASGGTVIAVNDLVGGNAIGTTEGTLVFTDPLAAAQAFADWQQGLPSLQDQLIPCFLQGTAILTAAGPRPVEALTQGDEVVTLLGGSGRIVWTGHRSIDCTRHPRPETVWPIRIAPDAFGLGAPERELFLSPDHAVYWMDRLVPVKLLANGATICQVARRTVTYYHVELARHDVLLAEGLPAESYLDTGNRGMFEVDGQPLILHPDFATGQRGRETLSCAPFADQPDEVEPVWWDLADRAAALGWRLPEPPELTDEPDLHVVVGGRRISPVVTEQGRYRFMLPTGEAPIRLVCRTARPCDARPWVGDDRTLGVAISRIRLLHGSGVMDLALDGPAPERGWYDVERERVRMWRWTNGEAVLHLPAATGHGRVLELTICGTMRYALHGAAGAAPERPAAAA